MTRLIGWIGLGCSALALTACGQGGSGGDERSAGAAGQALEVAPGVTVTSATYRVTNPDGFSSAGTVSVGDSPDVAVPLAGLPPDDGFVIDLAATASDNMTVCMGMTEFDAPADGSTTVVVHLTCGVPTGAVQITGTTNVCPVVDALQALPTETRVGGRMSLTATAHDSDDGPNPLSYQWLANGHAINGQTTPNLTFTCTSAGNVSISISVSDGDPACNDSSSVTLMCSP
ncbi:MAG TPA: hypothetical protein VHC69_05195 [Polyangiaceae bacterium]|nr:hypothetical protein [Polyangiaceae bacterium]